MRIFLTERPTAKTNVSKVFDTEKTPTIRLQASAEDIAKFIAHTIDIDDSGIQMDEEFKNEITATITAASEGM
jgi:hypothetical protein